MSRLNIFQIELSMRLARSQKSVEMNHLLNVTREVQPVNGWLSDENDVNLTASELKESF